jgi:hypothetical protein
MEKQDSFGRRGLLAAGAGAAAAALLGHTANAGAADGEPLLLGTQNDATKTTELRFEGSAPAVAINWGDRAIAIFGDGSHAGTAVFGSTAPAATGQPWTTAAAGWFTGGENPGAIGISDTHIGVIGLSGPVKPISPTELDPAGAHFVGAGASGLCARSDVLPGVLGMSERMVGVVGASGEQDEDALYRLSPAGVWGVGGASGPGVIGSSSSIGIWGIAGPAPAANPLPSFPVGSWGQVAGAGGVGALSQGHIGDWAATSSVDVLQSNDPARLPPTAMWAQANGPGETAALAVNPAGTALAVEGRAAFSGVGRGQLPRGGTAFVADPAITDGSHVIVTLEGDPGKGAPWVEVQPGKGFVVHTTESTKATVPFSYLVIDGR